jgi:hypothetical protein
MTPHEKINELNEKMEHDTGRFGTVKGIGQRLIGTVADSNLPGYWFSFRSGTLFHVPVGKHAVCVLSQDANGATQIHGKLSAAHFREIFGEDKMKELNASFAKEVRFALLMYLVVIVIFWGGMLYLFR